MVQPIPLFFVQNECMQVVILCSAAQRQELGIAPEPVNFVETIADLLLHQEAQVWIDLLFDDHRDAHLQVLEQAGETTIVINAVAQTLAGLPANVVRINAWPTFLHSALIEGCGSDEHHREQAAAAFRQFEKTIEWVPDVPGMVSARVIAAIINEAYFTLLEGIASRQDIDTAMKLGTAYPYGPFEWAQKIGMHRIAGLLQALAKTESRYEPCTLLEKESLAHGADSR